MSPDRETREETIRRLNAEADALQQRTARERSAELTGQMVAGKAYRIIAELIGGVLLGLAVGFGVDRFFGTTPWGLIGGVLGGFALSLWMAHHTAQRLMAQAKAAEQEGAPPPAVVEVEED